jgi:dihydrofolate reductase
MQRLIVHMTITVDGFIAKPDGTLWEAFPWPDEMQEFTNDVFSRVDTAVYGRLTYEAIVPWWADVAKGNYPPDVRITGREIEFANILQGIRKVVVSRTIEDWEPRRWSSEATSSPRSQSSRKLRAATSSCTVDPAWS